MKWEEIVTIESTDEADKHRKLKGILAGVEYFPGCISPTQIGLVRSAEEWRKIAREFSSEEVALRFDSKSGDVSQFISSQTVRTDMLRVFRASVQTYKGRRRTNRATKANIIGGSWCNSNN